MPRQQRHDACRERLLGGQVDIPWSTVEPLPRTAWSKSLLKALIEDLSPPSERSLYEGTLASRSPGARPLERTAAERYDVTPDCVRFDQKMNMTRQSIWNPDVVAIVEERARNRLRLVREGKPGYSLLDWSLTNAAESLKRQAGFGINCPNQGPTSWSPLEEVCRGRAGRWTGDAATNSRIVKKVARLFGAGDVGITLLDRRWVYAGWFDEETKQSYPVRFGDEPGYEQYTRPMQLPDKSQVIPVAMKYVAVFAVPMHRQSIHTAPTLAQFASTEVTYSAIARLVLSVAEFVRGLGYNAIPSANCTALSIPLAIDAGLGELGRNAKLIHPVFGPMARICKVITDLPLEPDVPVVTGASVFCETCGKCADGCPARAIPKGAPQLRTEGRVQQQWREAVAGRSPQVL